MLRSALEFRISNMVRANADLLRVRLMFNVGASVRAKVSGLGLGLGSGPGLGSRSGFQDQGQGQG